MPVSPDCNFVFLEDSYPFLAQNACIAESCLHTDPHNCIIKIGLLNEEICRIICGQCGIEIKHKEKLHSIIQKLKKSFFTEEDAATYEMIERISKSRNTAAHNLPRSEDAYRKYTEAAANSLYAGYMISAHFYHRFIDSEYRFPEFRFPSNREISDRDGTRYKRDRDKKDNKTLSTAIMPGVGAAIGSIVGATTLGALGMPDGALPGLGKVLPLIGGLYAAGKGVQKAVRILPDSVNEFFRSLNLDDLDVESEKR